MNSLENNILKKSFSACSERMGSLVYSINKTRTLFPLSVGSLSLLTEGHKESVDAFILRYSQCVTMMQDKIFRGIAIAEQEDLSDKSNRDKTLLMEKLGAIKSAEEFGTAAVLRNKFAHNYPEESREQLAKLNLLFEESLFVVAVFDHLVEYAVRKNLIDSAACPKHSIKIIH
jgi:hypothetical protein